MMVRSRIAPTPSGYLHIGNLYSFYITLLTTRSMNGKLQLRIDDLDKQRARPEYLNDIFETLQFMGIGYDTGPVNTEDFLLQHSQQFRMENYEALLSKLVSSGLVYACNCTRKSASLQQAGAHICNCRQMALSLYCPYTSWRIHVPAGSNIEFDDLFTGPNQIALDQKLGDFIVRRKDGIPAYQVASLADDIYFDINLIVRGEDLLNSTAAQLYLASLLGSHKFTATRFLHHPIIRDAAGFKLSKSAESLSIKHLRSHGVNAAEILSLINEALRTFLPGDYLNI